VKEPNFYGRAPLPTTAADGGQEREATQLANHTGQGILSGTDSLARAIETRIDALRRRIALQTSAIPSRSAPLLCARQVNVLPRTHSGLADQLRAAALQTGLRQFMTTANSGGLSSLDRNLQPPFLVQNSLPRSIAIPSSMRTQVEASPSHWSNHADIIAELERPLILAAPLSFMHWSTLT
jgi:hypothetical protein